MPEKYLITGFSGFVSHHFLNFLELNNTRATIVGLDVNEPEFETNTFKHISCVFYKTNLLDKEQVDHIIYQFQPDYILHFASYSSVAFSWKNPVASFTNNTNIFLNLIEQVRQLDLKCRILSIGSSEEYGNVNPEDLPLKETNFLNPISPYAVARVSQELLSKVYCQGFGMDIILTRSFNHIGPWQKELFVVSSFAQKLMLAKSLKLSKVKIQTGDLTIIRDFLDVRDVVKAYYLLLQNGKSGEVYNVCSGSGTTLQAVLDKLIELADIEVEIETDPKLIRPNDNKIIIGDNSKLKSNTGWHPEIDLTSSLNDILNYWESKHENIIRPSNI